MKNNIPVFVVILLIAVATSFYGGTKYQQSKTPSFASRFGDFQNMRFPSADGQQVGNRVRLTGGQIIGEVISLDQESLTLKLIDGSSKIIIVPQSASITQSTTAAKADITVGTNVAIFGSDNSDGSTTAQSIQLNPAFRHQNEAPSGN